MLYLTCNSLTSVKLPRENYDPTLSRSEKKLAFSSGTFIGWKKENKFRATNSIFFLLYDTVLDVCPLLDIELLHIAPAFAILGFPQPAADIFPPKVISLKCTRFTMLSQTLSPL